MKYTNRTTRRRTMAMTALIAIMAIGVLSVAIVTPSTAEAAKRGSYIYSKMNVLSSSISGVNAGNWAYFSWDSGKPLRINIADRATGQVILAEAGNVVTTTSTSKVTIHGTITQSGIAGLNVGDTVTYTADLVTYTATFANESTGQSASGQLIYANVGSTGR